MYSRINMDFLKLGYFRVTSFVYENKIEILILGIGKGDTARFRKLFSTKLLLHFISAYIPLTIGNN